jgi:hypothetical protein
VILTCDSLADTQAPLQEALRKQTQETKKP